MQPALCMVGVESAVICLHPFEDFKLMCTNYVCRCLVDCFCLSYPQKKTVAEKQRALWIHGYDI